MSGQEHKETVAIIGGSGDFGYGLAMRWAAAGLHVLIGSRDAAKAQTAASGIAEVVSQRVGRPRAEIEVSGLENAEAASRASVVVVAVPFPAQAGILKGIRGSLDGSILVDVTVPLAATVGGKPTRLVGVWQGSTAEQARELTPEKIPVLSAFHSLSAAAVGDLSFALDCDILVCGDDAAAKARLFPLIRKIDGLRPLDAGPLEMSRIAEGLTALLISLNRRYRVKHTGFHITGIDQAE